MGRSTSRDRRDRGRSRSRDRGEKKKRRPPTPANYKSRTRKASYQRVSDSEPDEQRSRSRSRGEKESGKMVRCRDRQGEGRSNNKMFKGYNSKDNSTLRKLEHRIRSNKGAQIARKIRADIFRGKRPGVPQLLCIAHKYRNSTRGVDVKVTPDTGRTTTLIPWSLVKKLNLDLEADDNNYDLETASGEKMTVLGTSIIYLEPEGSDTRPVMGIVTDDLGDQEILLSFSDMRDWGMLAKDFPKVPRMSEKAKKVVTPRKSVKLPVGKKASPVKSPKRKLGARAETAGKHTEQSDEREAEKLKKYLMTEFEDVFRETLGREDRMAVDPAELVLINQDVEPHYRGWAREIPAHYLEESKAMINELLEGGIISEVTKPVYWCTQGFFVPKPGTNKLRLVTDYREINKNLKRPEWPFMPSEAVRRQVDPGAKVFAALDF